MPRAYTRTDKDTQTVKTGVELSSPLDEIAANVGVSIQTIQRHYADILMTNPVYVKRSRKGRASFVATDERRAIVTRYVKQGRRPEYIAGRLEISRTTLDKYFAVELGLDKRREARGKPQATGFELHAGPDEPKPAKRSFFQRIIGPFGSNRQAAEAA